MIHKEDISQKNFIFLGKTSKHFFTFMDIYFSVLLSLSDALYPERLNLTN